MAETSPRRVRPWLALAVGALVVIVVGLAWMAWNRSKGAAHGLGITDALLPTPDLPGPPRLPDAPRIPDAPLPRPR